MTADEQKKIAPWLDAPERVPGEPLSRIEWWREPGEWSGYGPDYFLPQAIRAYDAMKAERDEFEKAQNDFIVKRIIEVSHFKNEYEKTKAELRDRDRALVRAVARAEKAESELARLREENERLKQQVIDERKRHLVRYEELAKKMGQRIIKPRS